MMEKYPKTFNKASQPEYRVTMTTKLKKEKPSFSYKVAEKNVHGGSSMEYSDLYYRTGVQRELSKASIKL